MNCPCQECAEAMAVTVEAVERDGLLARLAEEVRRAGGWRREWMGETEGVA